MVTVIELYYKLQKKIHNVRTLHFLNLLSIAVQVGFLSGSFMAYSFHISELVDRYGKEIVLLGFMPYVFFGIVTVVLMFILGKKDSILLTLLLVFLPTALLTESGMNAILFLAIAFTIRKIEQGHRKMIVSAISGFSEKYSPLYEKRLANKAKYKEYNQAYSILEFFDVEDFILIDEKDEKYTYKKLGVYERRLTRTFKIKGVWGKVTVMDELFIAPQRRSILTKIRKGVRYFG